MKKVLSLVGFLSFPRLFSAFLLLFVLFPSTGCRSDMQVQPRLDPQQRSPLSADRGGGPRPQPAHTVARGQFEEDEFFATGILQGENGYRVELNVMPFPVTLPMLQRGRERFNIFCAPCHSRVGNGMGEVVRRGYKPAANLQDQVRLAQPVTHYFYVISHGYNTMPDYAAQIAPADRWTIAAYIRALQLSQNAATADHPRGTEVKNLRDQVREEHLPESYGEPWTMPAASVQAAGDESAHKPATDPAGAR